MVLSKNNLWIRKYNKFHANYYFISNNYIVNLLIYGN